MLELRVYLELSNGWVVCFLLRSLVDWRQ